MAHVPARLRSFVAARSLESCEYCLVHADYAAFAHEVDHVIARKHGGSTEPDNLAYACAQCNRFKGSDIAAPDPETGAVTPLFHPRTMAWADHFKLDGPRIVPLTATGRATERLLQLNQIDRLLLRKELQAKGRYLFHDDGTLPNRNALLVAALERLTRELEQQAIDREFAAMAEDSEYRELQRAVVQEFDASDWEAWEQGEQVNS